MVSTSSPHPNLTSHRGEAVDPGYRLARLCYSTVQYCRLSTVSADEVCSKGAPHTHRKRYRGAQARLPAIYARIIGYIWTQDGSSFRRCWTVRAEGCQNSNDGCISPMKTFECLFFSFSWSWLDTAQQMRWSSGACVAVLSFPRCKSLESSCTFHRSNPVRSCLVQYRSCRFSRFHRR